MKTTYHYLVQLNGKGVKMGTVTFMNEAEEDAFVQKMEAKYMRKLEDFYMKEISKFISSLPPLSPGWEYDIVLGVPKFNNDTKCWDTSIEAVPRQKCVSSDNNHQGRETSHK